MHSGQGWPFIVVKHKNSFWGCTVWSLAYMQAMSAADDDSTLTQLATAWVNLYLGGAKVEEAFFIFQELGDKYNWTVSNATRESIRKQMPTIH